MALYFDFVLDSPSGSSTACMQWHSQHDVLAVGFSLAEGIGGAVWTYNKQGIIENNGQILEKDFHPTCLCWHPSRKILAVGWDNGEMTIWNDQEKDIFDIPQLHAISVLSVKWSSMGSRLASGDKDGVFVCWKSDNRGRVPHDPIYRLDCNVAINGIVNKAGKSGSTEIDVSNIADLAKAAVSGDEAALDILANFSSPSAKIRINRAPKEGLCFFIGTADGIVCFISEEGEKMECFQLDSAVVQILYSPEKEILVAVSSSLQVMHAIAQDNGSVAGLQQVKLSGIDGSVRVTLAGPELLAAATSDNSLKMWNLSSGDNFSLTLNESLGFFAKENLLTVAFFKSKGTLAAVTDQNHVAIWKAIHPSIAEGKKELEDLWQLQPSVNLNLPCGVAKWCNSSAVLAVGGTEGVSLLTEQKSKFAMSYRIVGVQSGPKQLTVVYIGEKLNKSGVVAGLQLSPQRFADMQRAMASAQVVFDTNLTYNGLDVADEHAVIWNGHEMTVYELSKNGQTIIGSFLCSSPINAIHNESVFSIERPKTSKDSPKIQVQNFQGTVKQLLPLQDNEGKPIIMTITGNYMVVGTNEGFMKLFDLTRRDAKPYGRTRNLHDLINEFGSITELRCNYSGSKVAILCTKDNAVPDTKLYVYDTERDKIEAFDFLTGTNDTEDFSGDTEPKTDVEQSRAEAALEISGRFPISVFWDAIDQKLLSCECEITPGALKELTAENERRSSLNMMTLTSQPPITVPEVMVISLFATQEQGLMLQDSFERTELYENLIGLKTPNFYFTHLTANVSRRPMRDFTGMQDADDATIRAMLDFSYLLTIGNMDDAFKAIKMIKGVSVWESMARMCVKTRRLDVAKVCLANMGHARGAKALREAEKEPERDARVARLALELGMNEEAERLFRNCKRYDLLNQFYQSTNQWEKSLEIANQLDRIHLRTTFYNYAKYLESEGEYSDAISNYEKSGNHYFEVPRMLFDDIQILEDYIMKTNDRTLRKWWAQYMESTGEMEEALKFYEQAADPLSLVRVHCYCGNVEKAAEIANETGDRAACYHLARQFENSNDFKQAIHFFSRAMAYGNAIRICRENGFEDQLMNMALMSTPNEMVEAAKYYEDRPDSVDKAVMLYHKAGYFSEALELAFQSQQYGALEIISQELDDRTDPLLLEKCANFYKEHDQADKAVPMLVVAKKYEEAINICYSYHVKLNENLVEKLTIPADAMDKSSRDRLLVMLGDCLMRQALYHLACQKYTQGGDKEQAMRALLKSGDTEKIVFFAGVSRTKSIYIMAANYLQSLDWRKDPEIMKNIITFYTKGRALDSLAGFYSACAQVEIDEYQNYDKALGALSEAFKCLTKAKMVDQQQQEIKLADLKNRIALVKKFIQARKLFESSPEEGIKQCHNLLLEPDLESSVRYGDVYGLLIEYYAARENFDKSYQYIQELRSRIPALSLSYFVNVSTIEAIQRAVGASISHGALVNGDNKKDEESDEEVAEEIFDGRF